jgi:hypothetical protein
MSHDWYMGRITGICDYAIWKNGTRVVGCMERPLRTVLEEIQKEARDQGIEIDIDPFARKL